VDGPGTDAANSVCGAGQRPFGTLNWCIRRQSALGARVPLLRLAKQRAGEDEANEEG